MFVGARTYFQFEEWEASAKKLVTKDFYGKVIGRSEEKGLTHLVRFTSVPFVVDAYFQALLRYAAKTGAT